MCKVTTHFKLNMCIDMMLNKPFWYLSKVLVLFQMISCRKTRPNLNFLLKCWLNISIEMLQSAVIIHVCPIAKNAITSFSDCPFRSSKESIAFCFHLYLVNRSLKLHEILFKDTSIGSTCCVKNSERLVFPNSVTNCLRKKCDFLVLHEGVSDNWMVPYFMIGQTWI